MCEKSKCCCKCKFQKPLYSHPSVDGKPMSNQLGFVCTVFSHMEGDEIVLMLEHGECEMFLSKNVQSPELTKVQKLEIISKFKSQLMENMESIGPEVGEVIAKNFWNWID